MLIDHKALLAMLATELDDARTELEALGMALCQDIAITTAHVAKLQALDHVGQRCASVADILRSPDIQAASAAAPLESIANRLGDLTRQG